MGLIDPMKKKKEKKQGMICSNKELNSTELTNRCDHNGGWLFRIRYEWY
jgi:hypothetical protein